MVNKQLKKVNKISKIENIYHLSNTFWLLTYGQVCTDSESQPLTFVIFLTEHPVTKYNNTCDLLNQSYLTCDLLFLLLIFWNHFFDGQCDWLLLIYLFLDIDYLMWEMLLLLEFMHWFWMHLTFFSLFLKYVLKYI